MVKVSFGQSFTGFVDVFHTAWYSHSFCGKVAVTTGSVPVAFHWFWVETGDDSEIFADSVEEESGHPKVVTGFH